MQLVAFFIISVILLTGSARRLSGDICKTVMNSTTPLNQAEKTFIFRCRPGDDCGGIGDRLGGVMGGAFYAMQKGRSFRIQWPGWEKVFSPGWMNWTYVPEALGIPTAVEKDSKRVRGVAGNEVYTAYPLPSEICVVNDLNTRQITEPAKVAQIEQYKHVFFHSNRGPTFDMFRDISKRQQWGLSSEEHYAAVYRCVFEGLFRPTKRFLDSEYKGIGQVPVPFHRIVQAAEDEGAVSLAVHYRVDDSTAEVDGKGQIIDDPTVARIVSIGETHRQRDKKLNLFFVTNSNTSAYRVLQDPLVKATFNAVYSQELVAMIHVNKNLAEPGSEPIDERLAMEMTVQSTLQAMRDWWILRQSDVLVCQLSGFCKSAALVAPNEQIRYEEAGQAPRPQYWVMCGGRFC